MKSARFLVASICQARARPAHSGGRTMVLLLLVSLLWAFSFGLIKTFLGGVDSAFVAAVRLLLALAVFLPFLRLRAVSAGTATPRARHGASRSGRQKAVTPVSGDGVPPCRK